MSPTTVEIYKDGVLVNGCEIPRCFVRVESPVNSKPFCVITIYPDDIVIKNENKKVSKAE